MGCPAYTYSPTLEPKIKRLKKELTFAESKKTAWVVYLYGFNGLEGDGEINGPGRSYTTEFRQYDPVLGRWWGVDPLAHEFPWQSPYASFDNSPINKIDPPGMAAVDWKPEVDENGNTSYVAEQGDNAATLASQYGLTQ